ncbi:glycerophosphodiester phosphodiesterase [Aquipuribacter nitratireducens]|uniref:glycerophosphodiester phosphodiesterase n=1 Tax=Aquipuribacter nitratireducens TaxID=650104 RepID=A0ABW0GNN5_9MICO
MPRSVTTATTLTVAATLAAPAVLAAVAAVAPAGPSERSTQPVAAAGERARPAEATEALVFGHRGASGYRPEHTLEAYRLAVAMGADYIEPDLVPTKDGVLVARHENEISGTTDVADHPEFAERRTTKTVDGVQYTGWFTEDFTLAELRTLRAVERIPATRQENTLYDGRYLVPTFDEVLALAKAESRRTGRTIGVAPETKHPSYFDSIGLSMEEPLVRSLRRAGLDRPGAPVVVQSFETANLRELDERTRVPLVQLVAGSGRPWDVVEAGGTTTYADLLTDEGLTEVATYAEWIGPDKNRLVPRAADGTLGAPTDVVARAHAAGLQVVPYTFRNENQFLPADLRVGTAPDDYGLAFEEYEVFFDLGVDGVFSDNPDTAVAARDEG